MPGVFITITTTTCSGNWPQPEAEIKMARLSPFLETDRFILKPTRLSYLQIREYSGLQYRFPLTLAQLNHISDQDQEICSMNNGYGRQLQLRVSYVGKGNTDNTNEHEEQFTFYPMGLSVQLNSNNFPVIWNDQGGLQPFNLTKSVKRENDNMNNLLTMRWCDSIDPGQFAMSIAVVDKLTPEKLLEKLKKQSTIANCDKTMQIVKKMTQTPVNADVVICDPQNVRLSLTCPISTVRMAYPCRSSVCNHLRCFDAFAFIKLNEQLPKFLCPVCDVVLTFEDLTICSFLSKVLNHLSKDGGDEIELSPNGTWRQVEVNCKGADNINKISSIEMIDLTQVIDDDDDSEDSDEDSSITEEDQIELVTISD